jgi:hypothetical protein
MSPDPFVTALADMYASLKALGDAQFQASVFTPATGATVAGAMPGGKTARGSIMKMKKSLFFSLLFALCVIAYVSLTHAGAAI